MIASTLEKVAVHIPLSCWQCHPHVGEVGDMPVARPVPHARVYPQRTVESHFSLAKAMPFVLCLLRPVQ